MARAPGALQERLNGVPGGPVDRLAGPPELALQPAL